MDHVYAALREQIVNGDFEIGVQLPEVALAGSFGVSRTPIREALRRLEQDGLVERSPLGGMRVRVWSVDDVFDLYDVRIQLEAHAAASAAERRTQLDLIRLREANEVMRTVDTSDDAEVRRANLAFHENLWGASHNKALVECLTRLQAQIMRHPVQTLTYPGRWEVVLQEHDDLVDAIESGNAETARSIAAAHMSTARDLRVRLYGESVRGALRT